MCGIGGWIGGRDDEALARMREALRHRGPDDRGEYVSEHATLFHERLSIIDVAGGRQPMSNEDGRFWIVFNGEIYNYRDLRDRLIAAGHTFRTHSDTEVILHLYEDLGAECVAQLNGMFAFAVWDTRERTLFLARDRLGIKPLFYSSEGGAFHFASELKAIVARGAVSRELDPEGLDLYLAFMYVPAPKTILKGVAKLPPGHTLLVRGGQAETPRRYWDLPDPADVDRGQSRADAVEELRALLADSVGCRLMSEVPLGAYLSGGLDSSLVVGLMSGASADPVNTFSVGFEERGFDERPYARTVSEKFGTNHRELIVGRHAAEEFPKIIRSLDEPVADAAAIPTYYMAQATKEHATVVLTGEGADELFAGYSHYKVLAAMDRLRALSPGVAARAMGRMFGTGALRRGGEFTGKLRDRAAAYLALKSVFNDKEKESLYAADLRSSLAGCARPLDLAREYLKPDAGPYLNQLLRFDLATWLPDDLLVKVDRMTMAHAVEARVPYLDHRVVERVMRMPPAWKLSLFEGKRILRDVGAKVLPKGIVRRKKTGFAVPVGEWAAAGMREFVREHLGPEAVRRRGLFAGKEVTRLVEKERYGLFERRQLWTLLCLELWQRAVLDP